MAIAARRRSPIGKEANRLNEATPPLAKVRVLALIAPPVVGGLLLWASFWVPALVWFGLAPVALLVVLPARRGMLYLGAGLGGLAFFLPGVSWIRLCDPSAWIGWLLLAAYLALYFPLFVFAARVLHRRWRVPVLLAVPVAWVACEYLRMHLLTGFGWLLLAHSLHRWPTTIQIADLAGVYGVSFLIALVNALWVELVTLPLVHLSAGRRRWNRTLVARVAVTAALVLANGLYGTMRLWARDRSDSGGPVVLLLQTNLEQKLKLNNIDEAVRQILALNDRARALKGDLVVWPETSYPYYYGDVAGPLGDLELDRLRSERQARKLGQTADEPIAERGAQFRQGLLDAKEDLARVADHVRKPILVGTLRYDFRPGLAAQYNSAVLIAPDQGAVAAYDKVHLVPFGEYLPLAESFPFLNFLLPYEGGLESLDAASVPEAIHWGNLHLAPLICFEDTLPWIARRFVRDAGPGAPIEFLVNQSNDGWFEGSVEADYHLAAGLFRCVEVRRPMVRVSNTGITAAIDSSGVIQRILTDGAGRATLFADILSVQIQRDWRASSYVHLGDWLPLGAVALVALALVASAARHVGKALRVLGAVRPSSTNP